MILLCTILFSSAAVSQSALLSCDDLLKPLAQMPANHLEGRWALVAGSLSHPASLEALKQRDSITAFFHDSNHTTSTNYTQVNRFPDGCQHLTYRLSRDGGAFTFLVEDGRFNLTGVFLRTSCPDCLVMRWDVESRRRASLDVYLLSSRRREVEHGEMEEYRAQLECLGLPPPVVMSPTAELCPEETGTSSTPAAAAAAAATVSPE
ncbi:unnamed protein product [Merluccius merluccius]